MELDWNMKKEKEIEIGEIFEQQEKGEIVLYLLEDINGPIQKVQLQTEWSQNRQTNKNHF